MGLSSGGRILKTTVETFSDDHFSDVNGFHNRIETISVPPYWQKPEFCRNRANYNALLNE